MPVDGEFGIALDGKPMRLPGGPALRVASARLAEAIAAEWLGAGSEWSPEDVNLTRLAGTAQALIAPNPAPHASAVAVYGQTDLLCYRAKTPAGLTALQHDKWQPWLDWAAARYDAPLLFSDGMTHLEQPDASIASLGRVVSACDAYVLAGLGIIVPILGSLVLGLAVMETALEASDAYELSVLDELFQEDIWGSDRDALVRRRLARREVMEAAHFMALSRV
jgi:chaperone required for assembly of F1-ATPase